MRHGSGRSVGDGADDRAGRRPRRRAVPAAGPCLGDALREGRGLAEPGAPRGVELILQPIPLTLQAIAFALQPGPLALRVMARLLTSRQLVAQARILPAQGLWRRVVRRGPLCHATVMPDSVISMEEVLTIRVPRGTRRRLEQRAKAERLTSSQYIRRALDTEALLGALETARADLVPVARAKGVYTDEDAFKIVS